MQPFLTLSETYGSQRRGAEKQSLFQRFLLPWMVLHCIVIAFLALGAAILTAHDRALLGWIALIGKYSLSTVVSKICKY